MLRNLYASRNNAFNFGLLILRII